MLQETTDGNEHDELDQLEAEERRISAIRRRLHDKIARGHDDGEGDLVADEKQISEQRRELHARIGEIRKRSLGEMTQEAALALLAQLEEEERSVSLIRRKLHDRLAMFPNQTDLGKERQISRRRRQLHKTIDALREATPPSE